MIPCTYCKCKNSTLVYDTVHYYRQCDGCGARGPLAFWREDADQYWNMTRRPDFVIEPINYIP